MTLQYPELKMLDIGRLKGSMNSLMVILVGQNFLVVAQRST